MPRLDVGQVVGPKGVKGDTGDTGPQGIEGRKGDIGLTGPTAVKLDEVIQTDVDLITTRTKNPKYVNVQLKLADGNVAAIEVPAKSVMITDDLSLDMALNDINKIEIVNLQSTSTNYGITYAKLYHNAKQRKCDVLFDMTSSVQLPAGLHYQILSIPSKYLPNVLLVYGGGTGGNSGYVQVVLNRDLGQIDIWCSNDLITFRGSIFWYY